MVTVTDQALESIQEFVHRKQAAPFVRIDLVTLGSHWRALALSLDRERKHDQAYAVGSLTFLVARSLLLRCGHITVDFQLTDDDLFESPGERNFVITTARPLPELLAT